MTGRWSYARHSYPSSSHAVQLVSIFAHCPAGVLNNPIICQTASELHMLCSFSLNYLIINDRKCANMYSFSFLFSNWFYGHLQIVSLLTCSCYWWFFSYLLSSLGEQCNSTNVNINTQLLLRLYVYLDVELQTFILSHLSLAWALTFVWKSNCKVWKNSNCDVISIIHNWHWCKQPEACQVLVGNVPPFVHFPY